MHFGTASNLDLVSRVIRLDRLTVEGRFTQQHRFINDGNYLQVGDEVRLQEVESVGWKTKPHKI